MYSSRKNVIPRTPATASSDSPQADASENVLSRTLTHRVQSGEVASDSANHARSIASRAAVPPPTKPFKIRWRRSGSKDVNAVRKPSRKSILTHRCEQKKPRVETGSFVAGM